MVILLCSGLFGLSGASIVELIPRCGPAAVWAQESWKTEFEEVCSKTQDAMTFSADELQGLVRRCDALKPRIEQLDETQRKVYLKRLQLCRDLFAYVLESKERK